MEIPASMADVLRARQARTHVHQPLFEVPSTACVIELTVVSPGAIKDSPTIRAVFSHGVRAVEAALPVGPAHLTHHIGGPHAAWPCPLAPLIAKQHTIALERYPGGRLWDIDVIDPQLRPVSRTALGQAPRSCLICDCPAAECARSARHPLPDLTAAVQRLAGQVSTTEPRGVNHALT